MTGKFRSCQGVVNFDNLKHGVLRYSSATERSPKRVVMPRETIEITLSEKDPYASGAQFLAVVAYPDTQDKNERERFSQAIIRWTLERRMALHSEWAQNLQLIRPAYFSGSDKQHDSILKRGMKKLKHRFAAAQFFLMPHLRAIDTGRPQKVEGFVPTVNNMAIQAAGYLNMGI